MMTALGMVRAGLGITILPASAREVSAVPNLRTKRIGDPNFSRQIALIKKKDRTLPPLSKAFADHLLQTRTTFRDIEYRERDAALTATEELA